MDASISKIMYSDYRLEGTPQVIVCNVEGEVKGFSVTNNIKTYQLEDKAHIEEQLRLDEMNAEKQRLMEEIKRRQNKEAPLSQPSVLKVPENTQVKCFVDASAQRVSDRSINSA